MNDYQAIYDAVRSRIGAVNAYDVLDRAAREAFDISHARAILQEQIISVGYELMRPSVVYRPILSLDGDQWCALLGENLQTGLAAFGESPDAAMRAFDLAWNRRTKDTPQ